MLLLIGGGLGGERDEWSGRMIDPGGCDGDAMEWYGLSEAVVKVPSAKILMSAQDGEIGGGRDQEAGFMEAPFIRE